MTLCNDIILTIIQSWSIILNAVLPVNESRPHHLLIEVEYFIDQEKYFYLILLHICLATYIGTIAVASLGTSFFVLYQHICSIFRIAR